MANDRPGSYKKLTANMEAFAPEKLKYVVGVVYAQLEREGQSPGSEHWTTNQAYYRPLLMKLMGEMWAGVVGRHNSEFPWSGDHVVRIWLGHRKSEGNKKSAKVKEGE